MNDRQNESDNTHTVALGASLSLGNHRGESMARYREHVSYSSRIAKIKTHTCNVCGDKLRGGTEGICKKCEMRSPIIEAFD